MPNVTVTLIGKPDCHLCDVAGEVISGVVGDGVVSDPVSGRARDVAVEKVSILDDEELRERYWEQIPVVLVDGVELSHWHVDSAALRAAILAG